MRIFNESKSIELTEADLEKGYLKADKLVIRHHEAIPFKKGRTAQEIAQELKTQGIMVERGYGNKLYRIVKEYESGGRETELIEGELDTPAKEAYDEYEDIQVYIPYTEDKLKELANKKKYEKLKAELVKIKEDIEQEAFGLVRSDYDEKKARAAEIINELRVLEGKEPRECRYENN